MPEIEVDYLVEGPTDVAIARTLIRCCGGVPGVNYLVRPSSTRGSTGVDSRLHGLNEGARFGRRTFVLRDLDEGPCPAALRRLKLPTPAPTLCFRIAVRTADAWLVADREAFRRFFRLRQSDLPTDLEEQARIKDLLLERIDPRQLDLRGVTANRADMKRRLGARLADFAQSHWSPGRAVESEEVPSLERAVARLKVLVARGHLA